MSKTYITLVVLVLLVGGAFFAFRSKELQAPTLNPTSSPSPSPSSGSLSPTPTPSSLVLPPSAPTPTPSPTPSTAPVKAFTVSGQNYSFTPNAITVNKGDKVRITFKNTNGFHNLMIDEFGVATKTIPGGTEDTVEFVADKTGSFQYYCSVGTHRAMGMWGTLTVK